jgi:hypothetical protein
VLNSHNISQIRIYGSHNISDNTDDEISHRDFLNAYLQSRGAAPVDFTQFETLQGSSAMGSSGKGRLTNLKTLNVDTSWYFRYRSTQNPDLAASFPQLLNIMNQTAIPLNNSYANSTIQAIANVASIHFAFIEQGGSSVYPILALKATDREVLRIPRRQNPMFLEAFMDLASAAENVKHGGDD